MRIWLLTLRREAPIDGYSAHVAAAESEANARAMVPCGDECGHRQTGATFPCEWLDHELALCAPVGDAAPGIGPAVLCSSFHAG